MRHVNLTRQKSPVGIGLASLGAVWMVAVLVLWAVRGWKIGAQDPLLANSPEFPLQQLIALFSAALLTVASMGFGLAIGCYLGVLPERPAARYAVAMLLGHLVSGLIIFTLGGLHLFPWGLVALLAGLAGWRGQIPRLPTFKSLSSPWALLFLGIIVAGSLLALLVAMAPVTESDGIRYQLVGPQEWLKAGSLVHLPYQAFTNLPAQTNLHYLAVMSVADARAAQVLHWTFLPVIIVFSYLLSERLLRTLRANSNATVSNNQSTALLAATSVAVSSPAIIILASWPFIDLSTLSYSLAAVWVLLPGALRRFDKRLLLCGLFCGGAIATKLTALITVAIIGLLILVLISRREKKLRPLLIFVIPILIVTAPWFAKNIVYHQNPIYPAAYGLFGGAGWTDTADEIYKNAAASKGFGKSPRDLFLSPLDVTIRWASDYDPHEHPRSLFGVSSPGFEAHNPGPALLALLPIALAGLLFFLLRKRNSPILWLVFLQIILGWLAWFYTYQSVRFMLLQIVLVVISGITMLHTLTSKSRAARQLVFIILSLFALSGIAWQFTYFLLYSQKRPVSAAVGIIGRETYLSANLNYYDAVQWLNSEVKKDEKVLYIGEHRALYAEYEVLHSDWFDTPRILAAIRNTTSNDELLDIWRQQNVRYILWNYDELRLYEHQAFKPRFENSEWQRYLDLRDELLIPERIVFTPRERIFVVELK